MEKHKKFIIISIIGLSCFTSLIVFQLFFVESFESSINNNDGSESDSPKNSADNITLIVDFDGEKENIIIEDFSLEDGKTTVFDAVNKWCDVDYEEYPNGDYYITHIDGVGEGWVYHHNDDYPNDAVNRRNLDDGDTVEFTYVGT